MLKVANKHARVIYDICSKLSIGTQKQRHIFSLSTTFNNSHGILIQLREFCLFQYTLYFVSNTFINNARLKLAENWVKAKTQPEAELLLFENYSLSSSTLWTKNDRRHSKKCTKNKCVCFNDVIWSMTMKMRLRIKSRSQRYDIN